MRERRWETTTPLTFGQVLAVGERLAALGFKPAGPSKDVICYIEEWTIEAPEDFDQLDAWSTEDATLIHVREGWRGDFFLLVEVPTTPSINAIRTSVPTVRSAIPGAFAIRCGCTIPAACSGWGFAMPIRLSVRGSRRTR